MEIKPAMVAITVFVVLTVIASVLIPVLDDAKDSEKTVFNNEYGRYSHMDVDASTLNMTITWDPAVSSALIQMGTGDPYSVSVSNRTPLLFAEEIYVNALRASGNNRASIGYSGSASQVSYNTANVTISVANGQVTVTDGSTPQNSITSDLGSWVFYPDPNGEYTAMNTTSNSTTGIYLNSINDLYFSTNILTDSLGFVSGHGDSCKFYNVADTPTYSMSLLNSSEVSGYTDVISTTIGDYAISEDAGTNTDGTQFVPFITMVPRAVDGHTTQDNSIIAIYSVIPALVILALIVAVLALIFRTRAE